MKIYEVKQLKNEEIIKRIDEEEANLLDLRFSHALKNLVNTAKIRTAKKTIARLKTVLQERALLSGDSVTANAEGVQK
ncbi:MAG: 50S ribosomal protein L29 [Ignavibacteriales bacterium]|nr:50S ribosomal protein L29 [Ignavibacteriales bacterium]